MKPGFRQAMTWLHNWSGLVVGWLLLAIAAAGTLSVFRQELDAWCHPELARGPVDQVAAAEAAIRWLGGHAAKSPSWYLDLADARSPGTLAFWSGGPASGFVQRTLSPVTGGPDGVRDSLGGEFFYRLHFELQLPYPWGRWLAAAAAMALLTTLVTGIVAHRRIFKDFFTLRTHKRQRGWLDGHVVLGVFALPFHLMIAFTGAVTLATLWMPFPGLAAYRGDAAAFAQSLSPAIDRPATGHPAPLVPLAPLLRDAQRRFGEAGIATLSIADPGDAAQAVTVSAGEGRAIAVQQHDLVYDGTTGRLLREHVERRPAVRVYDVLYGLHMGRFAGLAARWFYFLSGAMLTATIASGAILWTVKQRRHHGFGYHLVERLNIGFIAGLPIGFAGFLLANRLIPTGLANRAAIEVRCAFGLWGVALAYAARRRPARAWPELLAAAALTCAAVVVADVPMFVPDGVAIGVDGVLLLLAVAFGATALRLATRGRAGG
ncbi:MULTISPECIES: PepSY-associated TM helix domain-containing protein [unclassified Sphingomonas]|uniref:PepSY-associated TM helix domain-containing protein n=1 Tax=unclassified Sphingomonas TaxID=196159 RepID=UPI00226A0B2B